MCQSILINALITVNFVLMNKDEIEQSKIRI
jgi:hypothetical protein